MPNVVVGLPRRDPRTHRQQGPRAIQRLDLALFIQAENQRVVGRIEIEADNIADLFDKLRVSRQLKCLQPVRLQAERRQMREMVAFDTPTSSPIARVVHWVAWGGGASRVRVMMSTTRSSVTVRVTPGRGSSAKPSSRLTRNRSRHFPTLLLDTRWCRATTWLVSPAAQASTTRARSASRWAVFGRRAHCSSVRCSASVSTNGFLGRPVRMRQRSKAL